MRFFHWMTAPFYYEVLHVVFSIYYATLCTCQTKIQAIRRAYEQ